MDDLIALYCQHQRRLGLSELTIDKRRRVLSTCGFSPSFEATREQVEAWLDDYRHAKTRATMLSHLHAFYAWATEEGHLVVDPTARIRAPKVPKTLPRPLESQELEKLLANATPRLTAMVLLGALTGLRRAEIARLRGEDILWDRDLVRVRGKGAKERLAPLNEQVKEALRSLPAPASGPVFKTSPDGVGHTVGDLQHSLGISGGAHRLRHSFASNLLSETHDLRLVQECLGHEDVKSTAIYTQFDQVAAKAAVRNLRV